MQRGTQAARGEADAAGRQRAGCIRVVATLRRPASSREAQQQEQQTRRHAEREGAEQSRQGSAGARRARLTPPPPSLHRPSLRSFPL